MTFTCNRVFLHCRIATFTKVKDLSTSSTAGKQHWNLSKKVDMLG